MGERTHATQTIPNCRRLALSGCVTTPESGPGKPLALQAGDAPKLAGLWKGDFLMDNGWTGETHLTIGEAGPGKVTGVFEYFWDGGNQSRFPTKGALDGKISPDGTLTFGDWTLRPSRSGDRIVFKARERAWNRMGNLKWGKAVAPLPSEGK